MYSIHLLQVTEVVDTEVVAVGTVAMEGDKAMATRVAVAEAVMVETATMATTTVMEMETTAVVVEVSSSFSSPHNATGFLRRCLINRFLCR